MVILVQTFDSNLTFMYAIERKPPLQLAPETVFKSTFQMAKCHRDRVPLASEGIRNCGVHSGDMEKAGRNSDMSFKARIHSLHLFTGLLPFLWGSSFSPPRHSPSALGRGVDWPAVIFVVTGYLEQPPGLGTQTGPKLKMVLRPLLLQSPRPSSCLGGGVGSPSRTSDPCSTGPTGMGGAGSVLLRVLLGVESEKVG